MLIKQIVGPKPGLSGQNSLEYDVVYTQAYNNFAGTIIAGGHVCWDPAATVAQWLGFAVTQPATANLVYYAGAAPVAIAQATWGLIQTYGIMEECAVDGGTTNATSGSLVIPTNGSFYANAPAAITVGTHTPWITVMETLNTTSITGRCLIRAM
jgi:hypothetical protein